MEKICDDKTQVGSSGSTLVPLKQGIGFESCELRKSVMEERYPFMGQ